MTRIKNDKYYTPPVLAKYCVEKVYEICGRDFQFIEPSAGAGAFLEYLPENTAAFDIEPEDERVTQANFLQLDIPYDSKNFFIGNPPFGERGALFKAFYKKCIQCGDYIAFILTANQYNNTNSCYEFDLIYSEYLGEYKFSGKNLPVCFNIYRRPQSGKLNKKPNFKLKDVTIKESRRGGKFIGEDGYDLRLCTWSNGPRFGTEVRYPQEFAQEMCFYIHNEKLKEEIIECLLNAHWEVVYYFTNARRLMQWQVYKYLKENVEGIQ